MDAGAAAAAGAAFWAGACDIAPEVEGSDHCPVWFQLLGSAPLPCAGAAPPCAMRHRFRGKQASLRAFLQAAAASGGVGSAGVAAGDNFCSVASGSQQQAASVPLPSARQQLPREALPSGSGDAGSSLRDGGSRPAKLQQASLKSMLSANRPAQQGQGQQDSQADSSSQQQQLVDQQQQQDGQQAEQHQQQSAVNPLPPDDAFVAAEAAAAASQRQQRQAAAREFFRTLQQKTADPACECQPPRRAAKKQCSKQVGAASPNFLESLDCCNVLRSAMCLQLFGAGVQRCARSRSLSCCAAPQGQNKGRWFWTCELPAGARCGFFKW